MSDFPVSWSRYRRLSKLLVMAAISATLLQRSLSRRITAWTTTTFSDNPNSSKYGTRRRVEAVLDWRAARIHHRYAHGEELDPREHT